MKTKILLAPALALSALPLAGCAENYAAEGAIGGAAAGAGLAAITGEDIETYALAGALAGGAVGYFVDKDDGCDGYNNDRYLDDDCFGLDGYPDDPRY
ncbi:hypothetical protein GRI38_04580 [Altererythrobacter aurantiacus]|uniref:Glycine zipper n=1 Tax=Parapontixanthobacter aurantiacus TaxID=1463599 RepID=A0A844ZHU9_9SPHN|nr:glycine zipper domain-containing protein [Parapontixanthobacter aurantiacus]MXO85299.1 hypothetical protein [Parapontixanthobacter aurantiacus]